ncbi:MAG: PilW family protein [Proteobacteria bacterium]|nr:PilW family protein [Pseudomonadota bacterium]
MNAPHGQRGLSLIELMVAMLIGIVLISGAAKVYVDSKTAYSSNEGIARLQETARYAMSVIEPDVRMSNYWGLLKGAAVIANQAPQTAAAAAVAPSGAMQLCGRNWAVDLSTNLQGDNNSYFNPAFVPTKAAGCDSLPDLTTGVAWASTPVTTADTLTVRRASVFDSAATVGQLQVCSSRIAGRLISDGSACVGAVAGQPDNLVSGKLQNLIVDTYYVDQNSQQQAGLPSLRRKTLTSVGGVMQFRDQEIIAGVEDMQVQFGIDPLGNTGVATRYVNPDGVPAGAQIVAVRVWLLVRGDTPESNFIDNRIYQYGDRLQATGLTGNLNTAADAGKAYQPSLNADLSFATGPARVRRLLVSRTIQVRNALGT